MSPASSRPLRIASLFAIAALPVLCAYAVLLQQFTSIPLLDDYPAILGFAQSFVAEPSPWQRLVYTLTAQHNEYKLILVHSVVALQLTLLHRVDLTSLILLGNLAPAVILFILWRNAFRYDAEIANRLLLFLPVPFLLFQLNYAEAFDWAMPTLQNLGVIAFSLLTIHLLLGRRRASISWAIIAAVMACSASAGGFLLAPIGLLLLLSRRRRAAALLWCASFVPVLLLYAYRYVQPVATLSAGWGLRLLFFFSFLGSAYENMHHRPLPYLSILLGVGLCVAFSIAVRKRIDRAQPFLFYATLYVLGTAVLVTVGRAGMGLEASLSSRYKIYSDLLQILLYLFFINRGRDFVPAVEQPTPARYVATVMVIAVVLCASSDVAGYKLLAKRRHQILEGMRQYEASAGALTPMLNPNEITDASFAGLQEEARVLLTTSIQRRIYRPPQIRR